VIGDVSDPMRLEDPREFAKRSGLVRLREYHLADEPVEAPGSEGEDFGSGLDNVEAAPLTGRERLTIEFDARNPASSLRRLLKLRALAATHI